MIYWHIAPFAAANQERQRGSPAPGTERTWPTVRFRHEAAAAAGAGIDRPPTTQVGPSAPDLSVMHNGVRLQFSNCERPRTFITLLGGAAPRAVHRRRENGQKNSRMYGTFQTVTRSMRQPA